MAGAGFEQSCCVHLSWSLLLVKVLQGAQGSRAGGEAGLGQGDAGPCRAGAELSVLAVVWLGPGLAAWGDGARTF